MYEEKLREDHPDLATVQNLLGEIYMAIEKYVARLYS